MTVATAIRPAADEYAPYYGRYLSLVSEPDAIVALERQLADALPVLRGIDEARAAYRYAPEKWSIKQVLGHLIDAERVFSYRALRFARGDRTPLPGFDENDYAAAAGSDRLPVAKLVGEVECVRCSTLALFRSFDPDAWLRRGTANDNVMSVRALAYVIAGHGRHHLRILEERYLAAR